MKELDNDRLVWMFTQMARVREFEERVKGTFEEHPGVIRGHTHLADGAEASIVGSLAALRPDDQLLTTYRCHGYPLVLGTDPKATRSASSPTSAASSYSMPPQPSTPTTSRSATSPARRPSSSR